MKQLEGSKNVQDKEHNKTALENSNILHDFRLNHIGQVAKKHMYLPRNLKNPFTQSQKNIMHRSLKNSFGQSHKKIESQISHTTLVEIQVEDCRQYAISDKSIASFSNTSSGNNKDATDCKNAHSQIKTESKSPTNQFKYNCIQPVTESQSTKNTKRHRYNKSAIKEVITKVTKPEENETKTTNSKSNESTKKFLWSSKSSKSTNKDEKSHKDQEKNDSTEKKEKQKNKKPACSPLRKYDRSSLTIEPDKIMINMPKYSPCASRLAASSKILSTDAVTSPESPLHAACWRSPSHLDIPADSSLKPVERTSMQASLSLNIQQYPKTRYTPRSRSVGDSCVTSPTSEATTLSYSPTGTEILSLEEVGPQTSSAEGSGSYTEVKEKLDTEYSDKVKKATLETKC